MRSRVREHRAAPYRRALITGASSGIGRALCLALARAGTREIVLVARREPLLATLARELEQLGSRGIVETIDVAETERLVARMRELDEELGGIDLVVANAGVGAAPQADPDRWETLRDPLRVNVSGAAATLTALVGVMRERRRGHLVGIGSLSADGALPGSAAYSVPKAALAMLLDCLRLDLVGSKVAVTEVRLGFVRTAMVAHSTHPMPWMLSPEQVAERLVQDLPDAPREIVMPRRLALFTRLFSGLPEPLREQLAHFLREL